MRFPSVVARTCTCRDRIRTRSGAWRSSARSKWHRSTTWTLSAPSPSTTRGFDEHADSYGEYITRSGDIWSPPVPNDEPAAPRVRALLRVRPRRPFGGVGRRRTACRSGPAEPHVVPL